MFFATVLLALIPQTPAQPLARLVPRDTVIYVEMPSLDRFVSAWRRTHDSFDPSGKDSIDLDHMLKEFDVPCSAADLDTKRPLALCLTMAREPGAEPKPVFLLPARSPENFAKSLSTPEHKVTTLVDGSYVLVAPESPSIERDGNAAPIALGLPQGDVVARIDLARLIEQFRPMIDPMLEQIEAASEEMAAGAAGGVDVSPVMGMYMDGLRDFFDSAQTLDVAGRLESSRMELAFDLSNKPGSVLANFGSKEKTDVRALSRYFDSQSAINVLAGMDMQAMTKRFGPLYQAMPEMYPEPMRAAMKRMFGQMGELGAQLGNAMCASLDFGADGLRGAYFLRARDANKVLEAYKTMMTSAPGLAFEALPASTVDGAAVIGWRMRFDAKALGAAEEQGEQLSEMVKRIYGADGIVVRLATKADLCVLVLGGDEAFLKSTLARVNGAPQPLPPSVQRALEQVAGMSPCFVTHWDFGRMMKGISSLAGSLAPMAESMPELPFSILAWGGVDGPVWHGALGCDLDEVAAAMRAVEVQRAAQMNSNRAKADIISIMASLDEFAINNSGKYPDSLEPLVTPDANGHAYLEGEHPLLDPWGRKYAYAPASSATPHPRVSTLGRDGKAGGIGEDADIDSDTLGVGGR